MRKYVERVDPTESEKRKWLSKSLKLHIFVNVNESKIDEIQQNWTFQNKDLTLQDGDTM